MEFEFRADREAQLRMLCQEMGRSVDDFVNEAVLTFMEDYEDGRDAKAAWEEHLASGEKAIPMEEVMREYGLESRDLTQGEEAIGSSGQSSSDPHPRVFADKTSRAA